MKTITAEFRIVTPMFLGDANQQATSIRPPSIKGALRFWWRALNWKSAIERHPNSEDEALKWLHSKEARLFGIAADDEHGRSGQGIFLLNIVTRSVLQTYAKKSDPFGNRSGVNYLMGQGLWHKNKLIRSAFREDQRFTVSMAFKPDSDTEEVALIVRAFLLFGLLGGLGSRSRKGLGSIQIDSIEKDGIELPVEKVSNLTKDEYIKSLKVLIDDVSSQTLPPMTAFSQQTRVELVRTSGTAVNVLNEIGEELQLYRSWGRNGKVGRKDSEKNFRDDHDNVKAMNFNGPPQRTVFGLPHNYFFSSNKEQVEINAYRGQEELRRASPLLLHVHCLKDKNFIGIHMFFPSVFLPEGTQIVAKNKKSKQRILLEPRVDYEVIKNYLDRFENAERILG